MGQKTHPIGFRLGVDVGDRLVKDWQARWFGANASEYAAQVQEDLAIRAVITGKYADSGMSRLEIERSAQDLVVNLHTARPGTVIGRGGQRVDELRSAVERAAGGKRVKLNVIEIRQPEQDAYLVARNIADQLERRVAYRRAIRQSVSRAMQAGCKGIKVVVSGRLGGAEIARREKAMDGRVPLHTLRADIDYALAEAHTAMGRVGVKVWIYRGEVIPERKPVSIEEDLPQLAPESQSTLDEENVTTEKN